MNPPRILFVSHSGEPGGAELMLLELARHYRDRCRVLLLADGPFRHSLETAGIDTQVLAADKAMLGVQRDGGLLAAARSIPATLSMVRQVGRLSRGYDVIYPNSQKAAVVSLLAGRFSGKPVIWHLHDILSAEHFGGLQRRVIVSLANLGARRVVANSAASRAAFIACGGNPRLVAVVPNGIDPANFEAATEAEIAEIRHEFCPEQARLVGLFGRLAPWKGQHVLIEALGDLPDVHALIVGEALFGEAAYRAELKAQCLARGVAARVHFLGFRQDVAALMRATDVVVHASTAPEPFGRVIVESMLARRPVVAARAGATTELLGEAYPYFFTPGNAASLGQAISAALAAPPALAQANFLRATELFSVARMVSGVDDALARAA